MNPDHTQAIDAAAKACEHEMSYSRPDLRVSIIARHMRALVEKVTQPESEVKELRASLIETVGALEMLSAFYRTREPWKTCGVSATIKEAKEVLFSAPPSEGVPPTLAVSACAPEDRICKCHHSELCGAERKGKLFTFLCTRKAGHEGNHVSCNEYLGHNACAWDNAERHEEPKASTEPPDVDSWESAKEGYVPADYARTLQSRLRAAEAMCTKMPAFWLLQTCDDERNIHRR